MKHGVSSVSTQTEGRHPIFPWHVCVELCLESSFELSRLFFFVRAVRLHPHVEVLAMSIATTTTSLTDIGGSNRRQG